MKPEAPGFYWMREKAGDDWVVVQVYRNEEQWLMVMLPGQEFVMSVIEFGDVEWRERLVNP